MIFKDKYNKTMKSISEYCLFFILFLSVGFHSSVSAVTDAELEALEKQIEQQEVEEKKKAEVEAKQKAEERKARLEKQKLEEEQKRLAEEKRKLEEAKLIELERQRQEETKKRVEKEKEEKYNLLITEAEQAVSNKDKELAISKYNEALALVPNDSVAESGLKEADKLIDKSCLVVVGEWRPKPYWGVKMMIMSDGTTRPYIGSISSYTTGTWECLDSTIHEYLLKDEYRKKRDEQEFVLREDGCFEEKKKKKCWVRKK